MGVVFTFDTVSHITYVLIRPHKALEFDILVKRLRGLQRHGYHPMLLPLVIIESALDIFGSFLEVAEDNIGLIEAETGHDFNNLDVQEQISDGTPIKTATFHDYSDATRKLSSLRFKVLYLEVITKSCQDLADAIPKWTDCIHASTDDRRLVELRREAERFQEDMELISMEIETWRTAALLNGKRVDTQMAVVGVSLKHKSILFHTV